VNTSTSTGRSLLFFFTLELALSVPFWVIGAMPAVQVLPGLQLNAFWSFSPVLAALILVYREGGTAGVIDLLKRPFDYKRVGSKAWYLPVIFLYPVIVFAEYGLLWSAGSLLPPPQWSSAVPLMFVVFFLGSLGEELGWTGYALDPMQERWGALKASILLGVAWGGFHIPIFVLAGRSLYWIVGQFFYTVASRVLFVWIYNNTGKSLFTQAMLHAAFGAYWFLFPVIEAVPSFYDPVILASITTILAAIITILWGSKTLARYRFARSSDHMSKDEQKEVTL